MFITCTFDRQTSIVQLEGPEVSAASYKFVDNLEELYLPLPYF
jgi:hypothetical protein